MEKTLKDRINENILKICILAAAIFSIFVFILFAINNYQLKNLMGKVDSLQQNIQQIEIQKTSDTDSRIFQDQLIFLKEQTVSFKEFVINEQQNLMWLLGIFGSATVLIMGYAGLSTRNDIKRIFSEKIEDEFNNRISEIVGGDNNIQYLQNAVKKEKARADIKILLIQNDKPPNLEETQGRQDNDKAKKKQNIDHDNKCLQDLETLWKPMVGKCILMQESRIPNKEFLSNFNIVIWVAPNNCKNEEIFAWLQELSEKKLQSRTCNNWFYYILFTSGWVNDFTPDKNSSFTNYFATANERIISVIDLYSHLNGI